MGFWESFFGIFDPVMRLFFKQWRVEEAPRQRPGAGFRRLGSVAKGHFGRPSVLRARGRAGMRPSMVRGAMPNLKRRGAARQGPMLPMHRPRPMPAMRKAMPRPRMHAPRSMPHARGLFPQRRPHWRGR